MKKIFLSIVLLAGAATFYACKKSDHADHQTQEQKRVIYHCPMHPTYTSDKPGSCPICGMTLVLADAEEHSQSSQTALPGEVKITTERQQLIGVKTGSAEMMELKKVLRASARVAYDTELYNAIAEYQGALDARVKINDSPLPEDIERANSMVRSSSLKLRQLGFSREQMEDLKKGQGNQTNLILGERGGLVWIYAQIYEFESGLVKPGQVMEVTASAVPGKVFSGTIKSVDANLNPESRSLRVRAQVPNKEGLLKPDMYVDAKIVVPLGKKLAVPEEAVMDTGERKLVFVVTSPGSYSPREVVTGQEAEGFYEIVSGLSEGEKIVTSANFLIDSESRLKAAISGSGHQH